MKSKADFVNDVVRAAVEIASPTIEKFCNQLESFPTQFTSDQLFALTNDLIQPEIRNSLTALLREWQRTSPDLTPRELAWALRTANATDDFHRNRQRLELVWTGPTSGESTFRRTDQALLELIREAKASIIIATFAAYKVPEISAALSEAIHRGVEIILILESVEESQGKVTANAIQGLGGDIASLAKVYVWPLEKRGVDFAGRHGSLHVKCAVADDHTALISSANLTEYAMNLNMELGLMVKGGELPGSLSKHLRSLIQSGVLARCQSEQSQKTKQ